MKESEVNEEKNKQQVKGNSYQRKLGMTKDFSRERKVTDTNCTTEKMM
jgi:hypothetical protein